MRSLLDYPLRKARAHAARDPEWPVLRLPLLMSREFGLEAPVAKGLAVASLLLYGFADLTDDAQDGDLQGDWGWERAVNAGNTLAFLAQRALLELPLEGAIRAELALALTSAGAEMTFGQESDLLASYPRVPSVEDYLLTVRRKTGASAAFFAKSAAIAARKDPALVEALHGFGESLGAYYQILSDLDAFKEEGSSDLRNRKATLALIYGLQQDLSGELERRLASEAMLGDLLETLGAGVYCQMRAQVFQRRALGALRAMELSPETRAALERQFSLRSAVQAYDL